MSDTPRTKYVLVDDHHIAYQVFGSGSVDLLFVRMNQNNLELQWDEPHLNAFLNGLGSFARVAVYDDRGTGLSDPYPAGVYFGASSRLDDMRAVLDESAMARAVVVSEGAAIFRAVRFAASHPERVSALVICDGMARMRWAPDYPYGISDEDWEAMQRGEAARAWRHVEPDDPDLRRWFSRYRRISTPRATTSALSAHFAEHDDRDVRGVLPSVRIPTLVIEHTETWKPGAGRDIVDRMPDARFVELPGRPFYGWRFPDPALVASTIEEFVTGEKSAPKTDRVLATVLFTDVVDSTRRASERGDRRWNETLDAFDAFTDRQVNRFGGRMVKGTGDGHLATFDSPSRAILCACAMRDGVGRFELEIRAGLHIGEIELRGEDIGGIAVSIARRVCDAADDGSVFVSSAVPPLVAGSPIEFDDRGDHELKGVPGRWQLYAVRG